MFLKKPINGFVEDRKNGKHLYNTIKRMNQHRYIKFMIIVG